MLAAQGDIAVVAADIDLRAGALDPAIGSEKFKVQRFKFKVSLVPRLFLGTH